MYLEPFLPATSAKGKVDGERNARGGNPDNVLASMWALHYEQVELRKNWEGWCAREIIRLLTTRNRVLGQLKPDANYAVIYSPAC